MSLSSSDVTGRGSSWGLDLDEAQLLRRDILAELHTVRSAECASSGRSCGRRHEVPSNDPSVSIHSSHIVGGSAAAAGARCRHVA